MKTSSLSVKIDPKVKRDAEKIADDFGLSLSALINGSLKQIIRSRTLSFTLDPDLQEAMDDAEQGRTMGPFTSLSSGLKALKLHQ